MIEIKNITHKIGEQTILNNISLNIPQNGITALIGGNGAGKSTLLSLMARLQPLVSGSIAYNGRDLSQTHTADIAKMLAILTQETAYTAAFPCAIYCNLAVIPIIKAAPHNKTKTS